MEKSHLEANLALLARHQPGLARLTLLTEGDEPPAGEPPSRPVLVHRPTKRLHPDRCARVLARSTHQVSRARVPGPGKPWRVLVVTPTGGGALPVARHVIRTLKRLGHEVIEADLGVLEPLVRPAQDPAVPAARRDTFHRRLFALAGELVALLAETKAPHLLLALAQAPLDPRALARVKDLGVPTAFWFVEDYRAFPYFRDLAPAYDFFFHIQGPALEAELRALGASRVLHLPLAADPDFFQPVTDERRLAPFRADLSFMGAGYPNRRVVFRELLNWDLKIWGSGWDLDTEVGRHVQENGRRVSAEETVLIYNAARINLNLHSSLQTLGLDVEGGFLNPRTFEIAAAGAFQVVDRRPELGLHFDLEKEVAAYASLAELKDLIGHFLHNPDQRLEMGRRARERVLAQHTYQHRLETLLAFVAAGLT
ncbi:MAG: glycosyltransferase [Thermodesulfobacteriota bacterium]